MTWNLTEFFENESQASEFCVNLLAEAGEFEKEYKNNLFALSDEDFEKALREYESISERASKAMSWAHLSFAKDTRKGALQAKFEEFYTKIDEKLLFFMLEFNALPRQKQESFCEHCVEHRYFLERSIESKKYELSLAEERVLLRTANTGASAFSRLFDESMARIKFDFKGEKIAEEELLSKLSDKDRLVRKAAALSLSQGLKANSHLLSFIFNIIKTDLKNDCELRGYESAESPRHISNAVSKESVDALIKACESNFELSHRYYAKKREILGYSELYDYDRYAPLGSDDGEFSFDEAKELVLAAFRDFSPQFATIAETGLNNGWCDAMPADFKMGGAFSHSASADTHPFVLLNFTNKRRDVYTLAHEFGHAIHQFLSYKAGYFGSHTPLTMAETASVFCEMLVFERIKNAASCDEEKRAILGAKIEDIFATLFRQINFTTFERAVHAEPDELSCDSISKLWMNESEKMFGDSLKLNDYYELWWSYIPHFIHTPFYCYAYSYAQLLVLAIFGLYKSGKCENFVEIYTQFLSLGGSKSPKEMVAMFGFDIESSEFWQIGINEVKKLVDEFESL